MVYYKCVHVHYMPLQNDYRFTKIGFHISFHGQIFLDRGLLKCGIPTFLLIVHSITTTLDICCCISPGPCVNFDFFQFYNSVTFQYGLNIGSLIGGKEITC